MPLYLDVRQRKLGSIVIKNCPYPIALKYGHRPTAGKGNIAWGIQSTSK